MQTCRKLSKPSSGSKASDRFDDDVSVSIAPVPRFLEGKAPKWRPVKMSNEQSRLSTIASS